MRCMIDEMYMDFDSQHPNSMFLSLQRSINFPRSLSLSSQHLHRQVLFMLNLSIPTQQLDV
jgi:hypothetical protein